MAKVNGGQALAETLRRYNVSTVFTLHGGHLDAFYQAAVASGIALVDTRHEQAAGLAACGWAKTTGQVGVAMVTAGGGVTNVTTAVANAFADCVPTLFVAGAPPLREAEALPVNSGIEQISIMKSITKWSFRITHLERLPDLIGQAFRTASRGRPGPVYIEIPSDVMFAMSDQITYPDATAAVTPPAPSVEAVRITLDLLLHAARPAILAGGGTASPDCAALLVRFAELSGIPVLTNAKARGVIPTGHSLWARGFATLARAAIAHAEADVVLILGARFGLYTGSRNKSVIPRAAKVVQVDVAAEEIGRLRDIDYGITADCSEMLHALLTAGDSALWPARSSWSAALRSAGEPDPQIVAAAAAPDGPIHPYRLATELARITPPNSIVVVDGGETPSWFDMVATSVAPRAWLGHGYLGVMGEGLPLAIGAQVAYPDRRVVCLVGDGSIGFNFAEFDTLVRHKLPIVVVVNNDQQWGMSAHGQDLMYGPGHRVVTDLGPTRYDLAAKGFGVHAEFVEHVSELRPTLERAFASGAPACVNVITDKKVTHPITRRFLGPAADGFSSDLARVPYSDIELV